MGVRLVVVCCLVALAGWSPARGDDAAVRDRVLDYLQTSWQTGDSASSKADAKFAGFEKEIGVDPRAFYAQALVLMYQRRYDEAFKSLDQVLRVDEKHLAAWRAKIWLALLTKDYGLALSAMERMGTAAGEAASAPDNKDAADDAARFLGAVFGFVDGPLSDVPALASRKTVEASVLEALTEEQFERFKEARQGVIEKFKSLTTERQDSREQAIADEEAEKQQALEDVEKRREEMVKQADELKERRDKLQGELKDQLDEINKDDRPLQSEQSRLQARGSVIVHDRDDVLFDIGRLEAQLAAEKDPVRRDQIRRDISRLSLLARRYDGDLAVLERQLARVQVERRELANRAAQVRRDLGGQIQNIDRTFNSLQAEERRLAGTEKKARKPSSGSTGKVNALSVTATALKTYEPFPIEQERQRLMESLR